jgi:hypothetical protein
VDVCDDDEGGGGYLHAGKGWKLGSLLSFTESPTSETGKIIVGGVTMLHKYFTRVPVIIIKFILSAVSEVTTYSFCLSRVSTPPNFLISSRSFLASLRRVPRNEIPDGQHGSQ